MFKHTRDVSFIAGVVYFIQGAVGLSGIALPLFLRSLNWSISEITAVTSIAAVPWVLKIFYGLLSDSYPFFGYRRKSYLALCSILSASGWLLLALLPSEKNYILTALLISNLGFAATDVITDGLIVEHSTRFTSPIYQSIAWGSRSFGAVLSGVAAGYLAAHWPPKAVFLLTMFLPLGVTIAACLIREKKICRSPFLNVSAPLKKVFSLLLTHNMRFFILVLFSMAVSASFGTPFFFYMKENLKFPETFLGVLTSLGWGGAVLGSLIYSQFLRSLSPKKTLFLAMIGNGINILSVLFIQNQVSALIVVFLSGILGCLVMLPVMSASASMTHDSQVEGTLFAILMSLFNLGQILFGFLGGKAYGYTGLQTLICVTAGGAFLGLFAVRYLQFDTPAHDSETSLPSQ